MRTEKELNELIAKKIIIVQEERDSLSDLEEELNSLILIPKVKESVGKYFKYLNSCGSNYPSWWMYIKTTGYNQHNKLLGISMQKDCHNEISLKTEEFYYSFIEGCVEITEEEYKIVSETLVSYFL